MLQPNNYSYGEFLHRHFVDCLCQSESEPRRQSWASTTATRTDSQIMGQADVEMFNWVIICWNEDGFFAVASCQSPIRAESARTTLVSESLFVFAATRYSVSQFIPLTDNRSRSL